MWWLAGAAVAAEVSDEIVVWGDPFARWRHRWTVQTEIGFHEPQVLFATNNEELSLAGLQIRAVLDCDVDFVLGPEAREVSCVIEDIGLVARPRLNLRTNDAVLAEADATLTGATVQLQVKAAGQVPNVDLEGVPADNDRRRKRVEQLRQLISRAIGPFHLELPGAIRDGAQWHEYNSELFRLPTGTAGAGTREVVGTSTTGSFGGSTIAHYLNRVDPQHFIIQSIGRATMTTESRTGSLSRSADGAASESSPPRDIIAMDMHGVAIVDLDTGILSERVWVVSGEATASSPNTILGVGWHHSGRLRMLRPDEVVDVGPTWVARSSVRGDERPPWVPLEP
jgi:hypothetical protein